MTRRCCRRWTMAEHAVLREKLNELTYAEIGALIGRTAAAVNIMASYLRLRRTAKAKSAIYSRFQRKRYENAQQAEAA